MAAASTPDPRTKGSPSCAPPLVGTCGSPPMLVERGSGCPASRRAVTPERPPNVPCHRDDQKRMRMGEGTILQEPSLEESVMTYVEGFLSVYIHVLAPGSPDQVVLDFFRRYQVMLAYVHPFLWRIMQSMRYFADKAKIEFTFSHLVRLYRPLRNQGPDYSSSQIHSGSCNRQ